MEQLQLYLNCNNMDEYPQFLPIENCTKFTGRELLSLNLSISISGGVCSLLSLFIILLLFVYKAYQSLLQRLFIYLMIATALREISLFTLIEHYFYYTGQDEMCVFVAYFNHWAVAMELVYTMGILIYMFYLVRHLSKGNALIFPKFLESKYRRYLLESLYIILPALLTFVYASEPYIRDSYGLAGAWCWIVSLDDNCKQTLPGLLEQLSSYLLILITGIIGLFLMVFIVITYCRLPPAFREVRLLLRKTSIVLVCLLLFTLFHVIPLSVRMYSTKLELYHHFSLWIIHAMLQAITSLLFPLGFLLSFYPTMNVLTKCCKRNVIGHGHRPHNNIMQAQQRLDSIGDNERAPLTNLDLDPTVPKSTRVSPPSYTFFHVPYTNGFTHITTTQSENRSDKV